MSKSRIEFIRDTYVPKEHNITIDMVNDLTSEFEALQQRNAELEASNKQWESLHSNSLYGTMGELKAAAIREACEHFKVNSEFKPDTILYSSDLLEYAANLKAEEG